MIRVHIVFVKDSITLYMYFMHNNDFFAFSMRQWSKVKTQGRLYMVQDGQHLILKYSEWNLPQPMRSV